MRLITLDSVATLEWKRTSSVTDDVSQVHKNTSTDKQGGLLSTSSVKLLLQCCGFSKRRWHHRSQILLVLRKKEDSFTPPWDIRFTPSACWKKFFCFFLLEFPSQNESKDADWPEERTRWPLFFYLFRNTGSSVGSVLSFQFSLKNTSESKAAKLWWSWWLRG